MHKCQLPDCPVICPNKRKYCSPKCYDSSKRSESRVWEETATTANVTVTAPEEVRTLDDLIRVCKIDPTIWDIATWRCGVWANNYQVRAELKRKTAALAIQSEIADLLAAAKVQIGSLASKRAAPTVSSTTSELLFEPAIPDLHAGKLAWGVETGDKNYDSRIAKVEFEYAMDALLDATYGQSIDRIIFPIGNDLLNSDNVAGTTTAGTPQNTDSRYQKTFRMTRELMVTAIERLRLVAPVDVIMVPGNHDSLSVYHLGDSLDAYFHADNQVVIYGAPTTRKYYQWGKVMLMFTHGDKGKHVDYPLVMASEQKQMWADTSYREAHCGHLHKTMVNEFHGVRVRVSPALCPPDAWHAENQYTKAIRGAESFLWSKEQGLVQMNFYAVPE